MTANQRIVITGASGFIGRMLVPRLVSNGKQLLLVGRDLNKLQKMYPDIECCAYDEISTKAKNFDLLLHLASLTKKRAATAEELALVNVALFINVIASARKARIKRLINVSIFSVVDNPKSPYARSRKAALSVAHGSNNILITNLFLPVIYDDNYTGKLSFIGKLPRFVRKPIYTLVSAFTPTLHLNDLAQYLDQNFDEHSEIEDVYLAESKASNIVFTAGKRFMDIAFALAVIALFWWLLALIWLAIRVRSGGPSIFAQIRIGKHCEPFTCYKFRTMKLGTKQIATHELSADAITGIGAMLRKRKLDELPQVWNILRGELSLVGPRPSMASMDAVISERLKRGVLELRPGITGLAQINGVDMREPVLLARWDARYIAEQSLVSELKIIFATFIGHGQGDRILV